MRRFLLRVAALAMVAGIIGATMVAAVAAWVVALEVYAVLT